MMAGVDIVHVPSRGEMQAQTDLLSDRVQVMFDPIISSIGYFKSGSCGRLVSPARRARALPDVPTVGQTVPGYEVDGCSASARPRARPGTSSRRSTHIFAGLADPTIKWLVDLGFVPTPMSQALGQVCGR